MHLKSLELNWIRNFDRTLPLPEVMFFPLNGAGGRYYQPDDGWIYDLDGKPYHLRYGCLVVNPYEDAEIPRTIAHEYRHHWQFYQGVEFVIPPKEINDLPYEEYLLKYFTSSHTEMDAMRFEYKMAGLNERWEEALFTHIKDLRPKKVWL